MWLFFWARNGCSYRLGPEEHHSDYESYVLTQLPTTTVTTLRVSRLDGSLTLVSAYDATLAVARDTTFDGDGALTCTWMDQNYNWSNAQFKSRCGESLNLAVNEVADVLHSFYLEKLAPQQTPASSVEPTPQMPEFPTTATLVVFVAATLAGTIYLKRKHITNKGN
jgi:hypothetical protein